MRAQRKPETPERPSRDRELESLLRAAARHSKDHVLKSEKLGRKQAKGVISAA